MISPARRYAPTLAWLVPLIVALAFAGWDARGRVQRCLELSGHYGVAVNAPALDAGSTTGYALERRSLIPPVTAPDALHWVMQTQAMSARGDWRVRHVAYDNAPPGRPVHWGAPYRWWLLTLAHIDRVCTGAPLPLAIERSALWAGPVLLGLALIAVMPFVARRFGALAALVVVAGWLGCEPFSVQFMAGNADHHAPVTLCAIATVLLLMRGSDVSDSRLPQWHAASALAGAFGLWLSAATMVPVLLGIALGGGAAALLGRGSRTPAEACAAARAWRWWGAIGGAGAMLAWAIEYLPGHAAWRLEVIHPIYALAWWAGGELLAAITRLCCTPRPRLKPRDIAGALVAAAVAVLPGVVIAIRGTAVFLVADPFLSALHGDYIAEFQSLGRFLAGRTLDLALVGRFAPALLFILALIFLARRCRTSAARHELAVAAGAACTMFALAVVQIRWWGAASGLGLLLVAAALRTTGGTRRMWPTAAVAALALLPGLIHAARSASLAAEPTASDVRRLAERDLAHRLRLRTAGEPLVIAATPEETTSLIHFAGARGLGTMYWENIDGLKTTAALLGARTPDAARAIAEQAGVTHLVLFSWDPSDASCVRLHRGLTPAAPVPTDAFVEQLKHGRVPPWLKPLAHRLPEHPLLHGEVVRVFEVVASRPPARVTVDAAAYLMEMGRTSEAGALEPALATFADDLAAQATLAMMQARRKDARAFTTTSGRVSALLEGGGALPLEDHLRVVTVLAIAGSERRAATELSRALASADARAIRHLSAGSLSDLLELTAALAVPWPDNTLRALAEGLTPGGAR
ncbi:MAG: hypothetical protein IAE82_02790 [Opitutaceae bacterium]|nr:hypothetical protein [Opitutaceae bacterium]